YDCQPEPAVLRRLRSTDCRDVPIAGSPLSQRRQYIGRMAETCPRAGPAGVVTGWRDFGRTSRALTPAHSRSRSAFMGCLHGLRRAHAEHFGGIPVASSATGTDTGAGTGTWMRRLTNLQIRKDASRANMHASEGRVGAQGRPSRPNRPSRLHPP